MALEDAVILSTLFARIPCTAVPVDQTSLSQVLSSFFELRYTRTASLKTKSRDTGDVYALSEKQKRGEQEIHPDIPPPDYKKDI
jgi:hypothetical protein